MAITPGKTRSLNSLFRCWNQRFSSINSITLWNIACSVFYFDFVQTGAVILTTDITNCVLKIMFFYRKKIETYYKNGQWIILDMSFATHNRSSTSNTFNLTHSLHQTLRTMILYCTLNLPQWNFLHLTKSTNQCHIITIFYSHWGVLRR